MSVNIGSTIKEWLDEINSKAAGSHGHSINDLTQGYLNIHPENSGSIIPFINNDLAFLSKKGGSYSVYSTTDTDFTVASLAQTSLGLSGMDNMFDGSPSYAMITTTGAITVVIDMTLHKMFTYSNQFYIDFGNVGWRAKGIAVYAMNSDTETAYTLKGSTTANTKGNWYCSVAHSSTNSSGTTVQGFNKLRVVLTSFNNTSSTSGKRIAQVGLINFDSAGVTETFVSRGGSTMYGGLTPHSNKGASLGSSSKQWNEIYGNTLYEGGKTLSTKYASLDTSGKISASQLPSYVDDVLEYSAKSSFPATGEAGKVYVDTSTNITYRWSGSAYVAIGSDLALGETPATAYRGDRGKTAYDHSQKTSGNPHGVTKSDVGLGSVENKSSATIRSEITKANVTDALGYTPPEKPSLHYVTSLTVKDAGSSTSGAYLATKWAVSGVDGITAPTDGMTLSVRVPAAGVSGGILLSIDGGTTYYPIVRNVNSLVTTHYDKGASIILTFNSTQTASPYTTSGKTATVTGCWQVADYDSNTRNTVGDYRKNGTKLYFVGTTSSDSETSTSYATSYTNSNCYVGTDNCLYSDGAKVLTEVPAASADTRGGVKISFDSATGKLSIST